MTNTCHNPNIVRQLLTMKIFEKAFHLARYARKNINNAISEGDRDFIKSYILSGFKHHQNVINACRYNQPEILEIFLDAGTGITEDIFSEEYSLDILKVLFRHGFKNNIDFLIEKALKQDDFSYLDDISALDNYLHLACSYNNMCAVQYFVEKIDVNAPNDSGNTALHIACKKSSLELISYLISHGADVFQVNEKKEIPFQITRRNSVLKLLVEYCDCIAGLEMYQSMIGERINPIEFNGSSNHISTSGALNPFSVGYPGALADLMVSLMDNDLWDDIINSLESVQEIKELIIRKIIYLKLDNSLEHKKSKKPIKI